MKQTDKCECIYCGLDIEFKNCEHRFESHSQSHGPTKPDVMASEENSASVCKSSSTSSVPYIMTSEDIKYYGVGIQGKKWVSYDLLLVRLNGYLQDIMDKDKKRTQPIHYANTLKKWFPIIKKVKEE